MPYIEKDKQALLNSGMSPQTPGELNYLITTLILDYLHRDGKTPAYGDFNEVVGALECSKLELYRRLLAPYENKKVMLNGDVYNPVAGGKKYPSKKNFKQFKVE